MTGLLPAALAASLIGCAPAQVVPPPIAMDPRSTQVGLSISESLTQLGYLGYIADYEVYTPSSTTRGEVFIARTLPHGGLVGGWAGTNHVLWLEDGRVNTQWGPSGGLILRSRTEDTGVAAVELGVGIWGGWLGIPIHVDRGRHTVFASPNLGIGTRNLLQVPFGAARQTPKGYVYGQVLTGLGWGQVIGYEGQPFGWQLGVSVGFAFTTKPEPLEE